MPNDDAAIETLLVVLRRSVISTHRRLAESRRNDDLDHEEPPQTPTQREVHRLNRAGTRPS